MIKNLKKLFYNSILSFKDLLLKIKYYNFLKLTPYNSKHNDIYIVSYPKSGSTWLSFLVANAGLKYFKVNKQINFFNYHHIIPDIHDGRDIKENIHPFNSRIIKSHSFFNPFYKSVLYVIRHPEDVMISYFIFLSKLGRYKDNISKFIRSKKFGISSWVNHVDGWLSNNNPALGIIVIRYEDLKNNSSKEIINLFEYLGYSLSNEDAEYATLKSSFLNMKKMEQQIYKNGRQIADGFEFVRRGKLKDSNNMMSNEDKEFISNSAKKIMKKFNYS